MMMGLFNELHLYVEDLEKEAEEFLRANGCADAVTEPVRVPIERIARQMGLNVIHDYFLSFDSSVSGVIAFADGEIEVMDTVSWSSVRKRVSPGDVLINGAEVSDGRIRNTIAHECYHWYKHREYFERTDAFAFRCDESIRIQDGKERTDLERMEWQARKIAPRILMPREAAREKVEELCRTEDESLIVYKFSEFFDVSAQSAVIRLKELGYSYAYPYKETGRKEAYPKISLQEAFELYVSDGRLRRAVDTGTIVYADGYYVRNTEESVCISSGKARLTSHAKEHLPDYVLRVIRETPGLAFSRLDVVRSAARFQQNDPAYQALLRSVESFEEGFERASDISFENKNGTQILWELVQEQGWSSRDFVYETGLNPADYTRLQNGHAFKMKTLVTIAIALDLNWYETERILKASNIYPVENTNDPQYRTYYAYSYLFSLPRPRTTEKCNDFLEKIGVEPLGAGSRP